LHAPWSRMVDPDFYEPVWKFRNVVVFVFGVFKREFVFKKYQINIFFNSFDMLILKIKKLF